MVDKPFYFAWVDASETTFGPEHVVKDEDIFSFKVTQDEGDFAALDLEIRNPRIGLLAPARKVWAWLSWDNGVDVVPLFFGRLVAIPNDIHLEIVTLTFTARPADFNDRKAALAETLKVAPYWDPVFISAHEREQPDSVLEARTQLWHIDRITHEVSISDVLNGEDGTQEFLESDIFYDGVSVTLGQPPLRSVTVEAGVRWTQAASGQVPIYTGSEFIANSSTALADGWPRTGASLGGGWKVDVGFAKHNVGDYKDDDFTTNIQRVAPPEPLDEDVKVVEPVPAPPISKIGIPIPPDWTLIVTKSQVNVTKTGVNSSATGILLPLVAVYGTLILGYDAKRGRTESVRFTLNSNVQSVVTMPGEDETMLLLVSGDDIGTDIGGELPIGSVTRRSYFPTARGLQSLEYLVLLARATLALRARVVEIKFDCSFERAIALSCRMNALAHDRRLPGGQAIGKITSYSFSCDGDKGELVGEVTIGCAVGYGGSVETTVGDPVWVDTSWVAYPWQAHTNKVNAIGVGDVGYSVPLDATNDDGLYFPLGSHAGSTGIFLSFPQYQAGVIIKPPADVQENPKIEAFAEINFTLRAVNGNFESAYELEVTDLLLPAQINLEASS